MVTEPPEALGLTDSYKCQCSAKKAAAQTEIADQAPPIWLQQMMELMMVGNIAAAWPTGAFFTPISSIVEPLPLLPPLSPIKSPLNVQARQQTSLLFMSGLLFLSMMCHTRLPRLWSFCMHLKIKILWIWRISLTLMRRRLSCLLEWQLALPSESFVTLRKISLATGQNELIGSKCSLRISICHNFLLLHFCISFLSHIIYHIVSTTFPSCCIFSFIFLWIILSHSTISVLHPYFANLLHIPHTYFIHNHNDDNSPVPFLL